MKQAARSQSRQHGGLRSVHMPDPETGPPYPAEALAAKGLATAGGTLAVAFASPYDLRSTVKDLGSKDRSACCISPNAPVQRPPTSMSCAARACTISPHVRAAHAVMPNAVRCNRL